MLRMRFLSPRKKMASGELSVKPVSHGDLAFIRTRTTKILINSEGMKTMFFPNIGKTQGIVIMEKVTKEGIIISMNEMIPRLDRTIRQAAVARADGKLVQHHLKPVLEIARRLVGPKGETRTRNMHIRNVPRNSTISKPETRGGGQMGMAPGVPHKWEEQISVEGRGKRVPFGKEIPDWPPINRGCRSNETVIFRRGRFWITEEVA
jgi:hypothetical protein